MADPRLTPEELATILSWFPVPTRGTIAEDLHRMGAELQACWEERRVALEALELAIYWPSGIDSLLGSHLCEALAKLRGEPKEASE